MNIDHQTLQPDGSVADVSRIKRLHPTLRKCRCGFVASKHLVLKHVEDLLAQAKDFHPDTSTFWQFHGEVPLNEGDE